MIKFHPGLCFVHKLSEKDLLSFFSQFMSGQYSKNQFYKFYWFLGAGGIFSTYLANSNWQYLSFTLKNLSKPKRYLEDLLDQLYYYKNKNVLVKFLSLICHKLLLILLILLLLLLLLLLLFSMLFTP